MKSPSQVKISTISFLISLLVSLAIFGGVAFYAISSLMAPEEEKTEEGTEIIEEKEGTDVVPLAPEEIEKINGESFTVLFAGYDLQGNGFDAMAVVDVDKEMQKVTVYPINPDTKVYVGHGDTNSLTVRTGDLIKYKNMQYVLDKINATTGLKVEYYVTLTAEGFIEAFDAFNKNGDYTYKVPKTMEHVYVELPKEPVTEGDELTTPEIDPELKALEKYNISFKKGDSLTKGIDVYNMLRYKGDSASDRMTRQATFVRDIVARIIPSRFKEGNVGAIIDTAKALIKLKDAITTNVDAETFITETYDLISAMPEFSMSTAPKYTSGITNFK